MRKIDSWSIVDIKGFASKTFKFTSVTDDTFCISGKLKGDVGGFKDGATIRTSFVTDIKGKIVTVNGGKEFELGTIDPDYKKFLSDNKIVWSAKKNPIKIKKKG